MYKECPSGKYGPGCSKSCNKQCKGRDNACHHINGRCTNGCDVGYHGDKCDSGEFQAFQDVLFI